MLIDGAQLEAGAVLNAEVCVVGSGVAGISLALSLARMGHRVVVLEAGGERVGSQTKDAQRGEVDTSDHDPLENTSVRKLGGALALWGGRLAQLDDSDLQPSHCNPAGWPIGPDVLRPYVEQAHAVLGGGLFDYSAATALRDSGVVIPEGSCLDGDKLWRWGPPLRYKHLAKDLASEPNVRVVYNTTAVNLGLRGGAEHVQTLTARTAKQCEIRVVADVYVVAAGGLESVRLLLASRDARPAGLGNEFSLLGRGYMTHPTATLGTAITDPNTARALCSFARTLDGVYARRIFRLRHQTGEETALNNLYLTFWNPDPYDVTHGSGLLSMYALAKGAATRAHMTGKVGGAHRANLGRSLDFRGHLHNLWSTLPQTVVSSSAWGLNRWGRRRAIPALLSPGGSGKLQLRFDAEQTASSGNYAELTREVDGYGMPRLRVVYRVTDDDRERYLTSLRRLAGELHHLGFTAVILPPTDEFMTMQLGDGTHQMGLMRMSTSPMTGVVDGDCRLHSIRNVFVVSSGVFPSSGAAPPTLTLTALALRTADAIGSELRSSPAHNGERARLDERAGAEIERSEAPQ